MKQVFRAFSLLAVAALQAQAIDLLTPVIGIGDCAIVGISPATPAVVTVDSISRCGVENGSLLWIWGAQNTGSGSRYSRVNGHLESSGDTNGYCRVAQNVIGNTFQVFACDGVTPVANNGTWDHGGRVAKGQWRTRKDLPIVDFDGPGGTLDNCIQSSAPGGCYEAGRIERVALDTVTAPGVFPAHSVLPHGDPTGSWTGHAALRWAAEGKPLSPTPSTWRDALRGGIINNLAVPTTACFQNLADCGYGPSHYGDFSIEIYLSQWVRNYNLGLGTLTPGELAEWADYHVGDFDWTKGGHNYSGTTLTLPSFKTVSGRVNWASNSAIVTGNGATLFTTEVAVNDFILIGEGSFPRFYQIASIQSNNQLTLTRAVDPGSGTGTNNVYLVGRPWLRGTDAGLLAWHMFGYYATLCNSGYPTSYGCPDYGNFQAGGFEPKHNHNLGRNTEWLKFALTAAHVDPRFKWLFQDAVFAFYHRFQPGALRTIGGIDQAAAGYHYGRIIPYVASTIGALRNSFTDSPDFLGDNPAASAAWWDEIGALQLFDYKPGRTNEAIQTGGEPAFFLCCGNAMVAGMHVNLFQPGNSFAAAIKQHAQTDSGLYSSVLLAGSGNGGASRGDSLGYAYLANRPSITPARAANTSYVTRAALADTCLNIWQAGPSGACYKDKYFFLGSRAGTSAAGAWNGTGSLLRFDMSSTSVWDHAGQQHAVGPHLSANGKILLGGDGQYGGYDELAGGSILVLGSESNFKAGDKNDPDGPNGFGVSSLVYAAASAQLGAAGVDITAHYKAAAGVTSAARSIVHAKLAGLGYYFQRDDFTTSSSLTASAYFHYWIAESCGSPTAAICTTLNRAARTLSHEQTATTFARIDSQFPGGTLTTVNNSDTDGSYPGGTGRSFRVANTVTGTSGSLFAVHQVTTSAGGSQPPIVSAAVGSFQKLEVQSPTAPVVALLAPVKTLNLTAVPDFVTTHGGTAQYVVTGLAPGSYIPRRNSVDLSAPVAVAAGDHTLSFSSLSGTISVTQAGSAPSISTTSPLAACTVASSCSRSFAAFGGTPAYTWSVVSGSLPAGTSLSAGGLLSGTPTTATTYNFRIRVTDSLAVFAEADFAITINPAGGGGGGGLTISTASPLATCDAGAACSRTFTATGGTVPYAWSLVSGSIPPGMSLSSGGVLSGTPTVANIYNFRVQVADGAATIAQKDFQFIVQTVLGPQDLRNVRMRFRAIAGATSVLVEYGASAALGSSTTVACSPTCTVLVQANSSSTLHFRWRWKNGGTNIGPYTAKRTISIP